ncbi:unnamed protein product [Rhodiola kirilowii]
MQLLAQFSQYLVFVLIGFFILFFHVTLSDPRTTVAGLICGNTTQTSPSMVPNFNNLMNRLTGILDDNMEGMDYISSPLPPILGFAQCHGDLTQDECRTCFAKARALVSSCPPASTARVFLDGCFLRYDQRTMIDQFADKTNDRVNCSSVDGNLDDQLMRMEFGKKVRIALQNITFKAPRSQGFAVAESKGGVNRVYVLGQCWEMVTEDGCRACLDNAGQMLMTECVPGNEGRALNAGCYVRYSTEKFYGDKAERVTYDEKGTLMIVMVITTALFFLLLLGALISYIRMKSIGQGVNPFTRLPSTVSKSKINLKYEVLEKGTDYFDPSNKLGQGGAGSVFKGTLPDGRIVAVKRLFFSTRQWVDEFFNEVNLISGTEHKNLVKLYGCSIEGPESLLVYEYVSNDNLDRHLFDKKRTHILTWEQRMEIVCGIADGLAYLHGGFHSPVKIIHRDIKGSNILLDENMVPKIADFGLARCVLGDESHVSTGIAGTLGYMSPEYLVRGQLTEKADVYAFGVLAIEIVSGKKNTVFLQSSSSILLSVWRHYKGNKLSETVDASLNGNFNAEDASRVLQIGLLCTQTAAAQRPTMPQVVQLLNGTTKEIPSPKDPPFVNASILGSDDTSFSMTETQSQDSFSTCHTDSIGHSFSRLPQAR